MINRKRLCIDIGSAKIKLVYGTRLAWNTQVHMTKMYDTPPGAVANGIIKDQSVVSRIIREFLSENRLHNPNTSFVLSSSETIYRTITLPSLPQAASHSAIVWDLEQLVKGTIQEYYLSWRRNHKKSKEQDISYMAVPKGLVDQFGEISAQAGLKLSTVESVSLCLWRMQNGMQGSFLILDLGNDGARIFYCEDGALRACRMLRYASPKENTNFDELVRYVTQTIAFFSKADRGVKQILLVGGMANNEEIRNRLNECSATFCVLAACMPSRLKTKGLLQYPELYASTLGLLLRA